MKSNRGFTLIELMISIAIIGIVFFIFFPTGLFFSEDNMREGVKKQGYTIQEVTDKDILFVGWRGCGDGESAKWEVNALNPKGEPTNIIVCTGLLKGYTIRTE